MMTTLGRIFEEEKQEAIREAEKRVTEQVTKQIQDAERISAIRILMKKLDVSAEKAIELLSLPEAEKPRYLAML